MHAKSLQSCPTLCDPMDPAKVHCPWDSPGKNTGVGCHALLQGIFQPRDQTQLSYTAGGFFTIWATREAPLKKVLQAKEKYKEMQIQILLLGVAMRALKIVVSIMEF